MQKSSNCRARAIEEGIDVFHGLVGTSAQMPRRVAHEHCFFVASREDWLVQVSNNCLRSYAAVGCVQVELGGLVNFSQLSHFEKRQLEKTMAKLATIGFNPVAGAALKQHPP